MKQFSAADEAQIRVLKEALSTLDKRLAALENSIHNIDYAVRNLPERSRAEPWVLLARWLRTSVTCVSRSSQTVDANTSKRQ